MANGTTKMYYAAPHLHEWAAATGNASGYLQQVFADRQAWWDSALAVVERLGRPSVLAVVDAQLSHAWTPGVAARDEILPNLLDAGWLKDKWRLTDEQWRDLLDMDHGTAEALRVLCLELAAGRELPAEVGADV
ncbi:MAG: hypothetical protein KatS3mg051_2210 [Anaerolineae bacterium]|nr:MAG: hypothetical protein KatS3mg051_2210 [Anaerolineae bacterium]